MQIPSFGRSSAIAALILLGGVTLFSLLSIEEVALGPDAADEAMQEADAFSTVLTVAKSATRRRRAGQPVDADAPLPPIDACEDAIAAGEDRLSAMRMRLLTLSGGRPAAALPPAEELAATLERCAGGDLGLGR